MNSLSISVSNGYAKTNLWGWMRAFANSLYHKSREEIELELAQISKAQKDPREFAPVYDKYYDDIFIYISRRIEDLDIVADVTSRTFTNCLSNLHKFRYMGVPFSAWLYKIAMNEIRQFFRSKKRYPRTVCLTEYNLNELGEETVVESEYDKAHELVPKLLSQLNEKDLQCIELRFFEKKSFKEIGYLLGLTEVNAKVRTYRILKKLKKIATDKIA
jgi:RNA polymerase sigma-70 factor, ECF subfamily